MINMSFPTTGCSGFCNQCGQVHHLPHSRRAEDEANKLMTHLETRQRISQNLFPEAASALLSTDFLFGPARGKMFGILICQDRNGQETILRAFSGQYNGLWHVPGWAPPLFDVSSYDQLNQTGEPEVKKLSRRIENTTRNTSQHARLLQKRRELSRNIMLELHDLYRLYNFHGQSVSLRTAWNKTTGIPTGSGDCCAPKLLNQAARLNLRPTGIAEFYWGRENASASRKQGCFYPSCHNKCRPILGFLLCGLQP